MIPKQHLIELWRNNLPDRFKDMKPRAYDPKTANGLTKMIVDWIKYNGGQAERISTTGRYIVAQKKWIKGSGTKGSADISAIIKNNKGIAIPCKIEVKIGRDKQSEDQVKYQQAIEKAGGIYYIAKDFDSFYEWYNLNFK
jgi:hypothetical protein